MSFYKREKLFTEAEIALMTLFTQKSSSENESTDPILSTDQVRDILSLATKAKVLPNALESLPSRIANEALGLLSFEQARHRDSRQRLIETLLDISAGFSAQSLRFIVIKGVSFSHSIYRDLFARQFSDIDILVDSQDLFGADYVLRSNGFRQPLPHHAKNSHRSLSHALQSVYSCNAPYPIRSKDEANHLIPYYSNKTNCRVEVHDGIEGLPKCFTQSVLWNTDLLEINGHQIRIPDHPHTSAILFATAHSNMENFFSRFDGECNLRDYVDVHTLLQQQSFNFPDLKPFLDELGIGEAAHGVISTSNKLYDTKHNWRGTRLSDPLTREESHLKQALNSQFSTQLIMDEVRAYCNRSKRTKGADEAETTTAPLIKRCKVENTLGIPLELEAALGKSGIILKWSIGGSPAKELNLFAFRVILIPGRKTAHSAYHADLGSDEKNSLVSRLILSNRPLPRLTKIGDGIEVPATVFRDKGSIIVRQEIPDDCVDFRISQMSNSLLIMPLPYIRNSASAFKCIASEDPFDSLTATLIKTRDAKTDGLS